MIAIILIGFLSLSFAPQPASAAGAASVTVNGATLNAGTPYWAIGGTTYTTEPAVWNAYFNASTSTLTLSSAVLSTATAAPIGAVNVYDCLVYAPGDLHIVLIGTNTLTCIKDTANIATGIAVAGSLTISGSGSAAITAENTSTGIYAAACGIFASGAAQILSGAITADVTALFLTHGIYADQLILDSGDGRFYGYGAGGYGAGFADADVLYSGGVFTFIGNRCALVNESALTNATYSLTDGLIYVSEHTDGSNLRRWTSEADGMLAGHGLNPSIFKYVQFRPYTVEPQTGDHAHPWLWAGIAAGALLCAAGAALAIRKLRRKG